MKNEKSLSSLFALTIISASLFSLSACSSGEVQNDNYGLSQGYNNGLSVSDFGRLNKKVEESDRGDYSTANSTDYRTTRSDANSESSNSDNYSRLPTQATTPPNASSSYLGTNSAYNTNNETNNGLTAQDQGASDSDIKTTQEIRQQVVAQDEFSSTAKNIKIITINGMVVLKGPVRTMSEKSRIEAIAANVAGHTKVSNEITVSK